MHLQRAENNWISALLQMPDGALLKAVDDPGLLMDGKQKWAAAGRDPAKLITCYRYENLQLPLGDWESLKAQWREQFGRFIDRTYLDKYLPHIDLVEGTNETTDDDMTRNPARLAPSLESARAAVAVWNDEYRGKVVPAACRLVLCNGPVGNSIAREFFQLAVASDNVLGYHPYSRWVNKVRDDLDWIFHSGRWNQDEQSYALLLGKSVKPVWAFTECAPYGNHDNGWRDPGCLGSDVNLLVAAFRAWWRDLATTDAYAEGRILGPGAWFTSGQVHWESYQLQTDQLIPLARAAAEEWKEPSAMPYNLSDPDFAGLVAANQAQATILAKYRPAPPPPAALYPTGKGMLVWHLPADPAAAAAAAASAGFSWVAVKIADGATGWGNDGAIQAFVDALHAKGTKVYGWAYTYFIDPVGEATVAAWRCTRFGLDGFLIDAEGEAASAPAGKAATYAANLRSRLIGLPIGLCSYRYPALHPTPAWGELLPVCNFHAPQLYWLGKTAPDQPGLQLTESVKELTALKALPVIPIGCAFGWTPAGGAAWAPSLAQLQNFIDTAAALKLPGYGWYDWESAEPHADWWALIAKAAGS